MTITNLPSAPTRNDSPDEFSSKSDASLGALPNFVVEANTTTTEVQSNKFAAAASSSQASLYTSEATNSAQVSSANANYKGIWSDQTGAAVVPYSVYNSDYFWILVSNIADVTASEPSDSNTDWRVSEAIPELRVPTAVQPLSGTTGVMPTATLEASAYAPLYSTDSRLHRRFEVTTAADTTFASPVFTSDVDANSVVSSSLTLETAHIWRCKDVIELPDSSLINSGWMPTQSFTTTGVFVNAPTLSVEGSPTSVTEEPELTAGAFDTTPTGQTTHASTDWEVRVTSTDALVYTSVTDAVNLTSITVPSGVLEVDTEYTFRVRYNGTAYGSSTYTEVTATTEAVFDVTPFLAVGSLTPKTLVIYQQEVDTFTKVTDPSTLPSTRSFGLDFSHDNVYLAAGGLGNPYVIIYKRSIGSTVFTKLANPSTLPTGEGNDCSFSSDSTYLAVAHPNTPYITIYKRSGDVFTKLANPATLPTGEGNACSFSSDSTYLAVSHTSSPYITIYKRSGDTFTKLTNPPTLPTNTASGCTFSSDSTYLAVSHLSPPYVTIYKRSGDTFTKLANPSTLPTGNGYGVSFSGDDTYLAVSHTTSPYVTIYKRSGDVFTKLANPASLPAGIGWGVSFSSDSVYLSVGHTTSPCITIYKRSGDVFTKLANPSTLPNNTGYAVAFSK